MIDATHFELIKRKHGSYGSWAVWASQGQTPKSNMGDIEVLDPRANPSLLQTLNPGVVMVGLNLSRGFPDSPFRNFHDPDPVANDFKIRHAFSGTSYWGAYMTDVIKRHVELDSAQLLNHLRANPQVIKDHVEALRSEVLDLGHPKPVILAFGRAAYSLLERNLSCNDYSLLVRITHYSHYISMENYRLAVHQQIASSLRDTAQQAYPSENFEVD